MSIHAFPLVSLWPPWPHPGHPGNGRYPRAAPWPPSLLALSRYLCPSQKSDPPSAPVSTIAQIHSFCALRTESDPLSPTPSPRPAPPTSGVVHL